jgi:hypothetical protein
MCHKATCKKCSKPTWKGCGNHVEQALADVPKNHRCTCRENPIAAPSTGGFFSRLRAN